jgi:phosphoribosylformylglycinamidine synthase PurS subunit
MRYRSRIEVSLKPGHSDPEGETTARLLREMGFEIETVSISKLYTLILAARNRRQARTIADDICKKLLANPTKDNYAIKTEEDR